MQINEAKNHNLEAVFAAIFQKPCQVSVHPTQTGYSVMLFDRSDEASVEALPFLMLNVKLNGTTKIHAKVSSWFEAKIHEAITSDSEEECLGRRSPK